MEKDERISVVASVNSAGTEVKFLGDREALSDLMMSVAALQRNQAEAEASTGQIKSDERVSLARFKLQFDLKQSQDRLQFCLALIAGVIMLVVIFSFVGGQKNGQNHYGYVSQRSAPV